MNARKEVASIVNQRTSKAINKGEEDNKNIKIRNTMSSEFSLIPEPEASERIIRITVDSIENVVRRDTVTLTILVYHNDTLLGESQPLRIEPDFREPPTKYPIDYNTQLSISITDRSNIDAVVSTPLLIQVTERQENEAGLHSASSGAGDSKKKEKSKGSRKSIDSKEPRIMGLCNFDILPMLLGETSVTESLIVEALTLSSATREMSSWMNLPVLTLTLTQDESNFFPPNLQVNYLSLTVESIYNPPTSFAESIQCKVATVIYIDSEDPETVLIDRGQFSKYRDVERTKRWKTLSGKCEGRAGLSKYKIESDYEDTKNQLETDIELKTVFGKDNLRIEWNCLSRHLLLGSGQQVMKDTINRYNYWPFQFVIPSNVSEGGKTKSKESRPRLYQCYVDASELLFPGRTQTRVITQLYTYNSSDMIEKTGFGENLFNIDVSNEAKPKDKKGKPNTKGSSSVNTVSIEPEVESSYPVTNERGEPAFVVIQFELQKPLVASRTMEELIQDLHELLGPPDQLSPYPYTGNLAEDQYFQCIRKSVETITEIYRDFYEENNKCSPQSGDSTGPGERYPYIPDETERFVQYLYDTGNYIAIQTTLKKKIILLLDQKFKSRLCTLDSEMSQNFVATAYVYLVEQMHATLNTESGEQFESELKNSKATDKLYYYAEENYELGNIAQAKNNYITLVTERRKDPDAWLRYAIFLKKLGDRELAVECCREAIKMDCRNKLALLLHGVILTENEDFEAAEIFFQVTTQLYPLFAEGWAVLHLFYHRTEYFPGVDLTIRIAEQCLKDQDRDTAGMECLEEEPLAWTMIHCPNDRIYLIAAVFLLKLNLFDFAGIALAKELSLAGRSTSWLYYMAVHHYLLGRFDDALTHLKEAQIQYGMDYSISGLMGHCHLQKGDTKPAFECYEYASTLFNRPDDIHLIDLRMGNYYLDTGEYERAKKKFLCVCKMSPTAFTWLGLGVACYHAMDLKDAETALTEANRLDHTNPEVWAYLCLLNMTLQRYDEFAECYRRMVKNDLQKAKVWLLIENTMESLGLSSPMLLSAASGNTVIKESLQEDVM